LEQAILTDAIRSELITHGVLGHPELTMTTLSPFCLDRPSRYLRDLYRPWTVMEQWHPETRLPARSVLAHVPSPTPRLTLPAAQPTAHRTYTHLSPSTHT
ncbi:hypothetical protein, partial [Escherichia coli]|uniref:hypothetical protein n=1 Tax=Escherichia coli TaxID=562 RepID=UPI003D779355